MGYGYQQPQAPPRQQQPQEIDFTAFDTETIKQHLRSRNLSTNGDRNALLKRLKDEVNKAWSQYYARDQQGAGFPNQGFGFGGNFNMANNNQNPPKKKKRRKRKRSQLTEEERAKMEEERRLAKERKEARKAENRKRMEEAREKKRQKREEAAKRQAEMEKKQKEQKEKRQRSEVFVYFDMKAFSDQLMKALDPAGNRINACNYDFSHKGFRVRFNDPTHASTCAQGATMSDPKTVKVPTTLQVLPAPIESHCVFFLDPCHAGHPEKKEAFEWVAEQGVETKTSDVKTLNLWKESTTEKCRRYGNIVNIYRERGFIVVQFQSEAAAEAMFEALSEGETLNGITMLYMKRGTPKKRDRLECDKKYPKTPKIKKKKKPVEEVKEEEDEEEAEN